MSTATNKTYNKYKEKDNVKTDQQRRNGFYLIACYT